MLTLLATSSTVFGQSFDLEQFEQAFRPRLRLEGRWLPQTNDNSQHSTLEDRSGAGVLTFPIARTLNANVQLDLTSDSWKELLLNGLRVRASQVMGSVKYGYREVSFGNNFSEPKSLHSASAGLMGISLTKKFRILFWNANANISEENSTLNNPAFRFMGMIGKMRVKGLHRQFFYGAVLVASDGFFAPLPFVGGQVPIGKRLSFNYILPVQMALAWRIKKGALQAGVGLDAWRYGVYSEMNGPRDANLNYQAVRGFVSARKKLNNTFQIRGEVSYAFHRVNMTSGINEIVQKPLEPGVSATIGLNILFGKSVVEQILNEALH